MRCPECQHPESRVIDSRSAGDTIRRRRVCEACGARFTTHERVEPRVLWVVKKSGRKEPFSRDKILAGLALACRKRPVDAAGIETAVRRVESALEGLAAAGEITSTQVGEAVMEELRSIDTVSYVRFASVYHEFESVEQFADFIVRLRAPTQPGTR